MIKCPIDIGTQILAGSLDESKEALRIKLRDELLSDARLTNSRVLFAQNMQRLKMLTGFDVGLYVSDFPLFDDRRAFKSVFCESRWYDAGPTGQAGITFGAFKQTVHGGDRDGPSVALSSASIEWSMDAVGIVEQPEAYHAFLTTASHNIGAYFVFGYSDIAFERAIHCPLFYSIITLFHQSMIEGYFKKRAAIALSPQERAILALIILGESGDGIPNALGISRNTVDTYLRRIFQKLGVSNRTQAALKGFQLGLVTKEIEDFRKLDSRLRNVNA